MKAINVKVGVLIENLGPPGSGWSRPKTGGSLSPGDIGEVVEIRSPKEPVPGLEIGEDENGDMQYDPGSDGYAVVLWPNNWGRGLIWPDSEGQRWRKVMGKKQ